MRFVKHRLKYCVKIYITKNISSRGILSQYKGKSKGELSLMLAFDTKAYKQKTYKFVFSFFYKYPAAGTIRYL